MKKLIALACILSAFAVSGLAQTTTPSPLAPAVVGAANDSAAPAKSAKPAKAVKKAKHAGKKTRKAKKAKAKAAQ